MKILYFDICAILIMVVMTADLPTLGLEIA